MFVQWYQKMILLLSNDLRIPQFVAERNMKFQIIVDICILANVHSEFHCNIFNLNTLSMIIMAIPFVEFSWEGYKIRKIFG